MGCSTVVSNFQRFQFWLLPLEFCSQLSLCEFEALMRQSRRLVNVALPVTIIESSVSLSLFTFVFAGLTLSFVGRGGDIDRDTTTVSCSNEVCIRRICSRRFQYRLKLLLWRLQVDTEQQMKEDDFDFIADIVDFMLMPHETPSIGKFSGCAIEVIAFKASRAAV